MEQEENTLTAFRNTYDAGCHGFETDIHFDADKDLVIIHDYSLERMTNGRGTVEKSSTQYIKTLKTKGGNPVLFLDELVDLGIDHNRASSVALIDLNSCSKFGVKTPLPIDDSISAIGQ